MNSTGETAPSSGWFHRNSASIPDHVPAEPEQRLVVNRELPALVGHPQVVGQLALAPAVRADHRRCSSS